MKIFLTEIEAYGTIFAGPNIIAENIEEAEEAAKNNGINVIGELDSIYIDDDNNEHMNVLDEDTVVH